MAVLPKPGDILLEKYELEYELGRGGYGVVYKARTLSTDRPVAVKILKPERSKESPRVEERFRREMKTVAQLQCPHTMTLYDFGRTDDGALFMVCEYVEGVDLLDLIVRRGTLKEKYVLDILRQMLLSLAEAHSLGVLHRDIKPANIRVEFPEKQRLRAKLLDFGLAHRLDANDPRLTKKGFVVGTPRYMSPEQIRGTKVGPASDIFSLGVVMVEALLGRGSVQVGEPVELTQDDDVNAALRDVLNRMTEPSFKDRYATAADVLADLPRRLDPTDMDEVEDEPPPAITKATHEKTTTVFKQADAEEAVRKQDQRLRLIAVVLIAVLGVMAALTAMILVGSEPQPTRDAPDGLIRRAMTPSEGSARGDGTPDAADLRPVPETNCADMPDLAPGVHEVVLEDVLSEDRVWVFLPPGYDRRNRHRVILMFTDLHRTGEDAIRMVARQPHKPELEQFVVISGTPRGALWFHAGEQFRKGWDRLQRLSQKLCIDRNAVFLLGHGAGAAPVLRGICKQPVLAAGTLGFRIRGDGEVCRRPKAPLLNIEVDDNPYAPIDGSAPCTAPVAIRSLRAHEITFESRFNCEGSRWEVSHDDGSTCWHRNCTPGFESCVVEGGRDWPGTPPLPGPCGSTPGDYDFRERFWTFFSDQAPRKPPADPR